MFRLAVVICLIAYSAAQSISPGCLTALEGILADPGATQCLATSAILPLVTAASSNTSIVQPLNTWLTSLCSSPACNDATLAALASDITSGCPTELKGLGLPTDAATLTSDLEAIYPTFRNVVCLYHGSTLCITETLTNIQNTVGTLNLSEILSIFQNPPGSLPTSTICTDCNQEFYNLLTAASPVPSVTSYFQSECGASFVGGSVPSDVTVSANSAVVTGS